MLPGVWGTLCIPALALAAPNQGDPPLWYFDVDPDGDEFLMDSLEVHLDDLRRDLGANGEPRLPVSKRTPQSKEFNQVLKASLDKLDGVIKTAAAANKQDEVARQNAAESISVDSIRKAFNDIMERVPAHRMQDKEVKRALRSWQVHMMDLEAEVAKSEMKAKSEGGSEEGTEAPQEEARGAQGGAMVPSDEDGATGEPAVSISKKKKRVVNKAHKGDKADKADKADTADKAAEQEDEGFDMNFAVALSLLVLLPTVVMCNMKRNRTKEQVLVSMRTKLDRLMTQFPPEQADDPGVRAAFKAVGKHLDELELLMAKGGSTPKAIKEQKKEIKRLLPKLTKILNFLQQEADHIKPVTRTTILRQWFFAESVPTMKPPTETDKSN